MTALLQAPDGVLWIGTVDGLNFLKNERLAAYSGNDELTSNFIKNISLGPGNRLLVVSRSSLFIMKDGQFLTITQKDGLFTDGIHAVLHDDRGDLWMSSNKGIFQLDGIQLRGFLDGSLKQLTCRSYNEDDGMISRECNGTRQPCAFRGRDGKLWFPTVKGLVMIDPNNLKPNPLPPPVKIEAFIAEDREFIPPSKPGTPVQVLSPGYQRFEFRFTGLSFKNPGKVRFKCRLEGFDRDWRQLGTRRSAYYTHLSPGLYTFYVTSANNDGVWNSQPASFSFQLQAYFYQTFWFYLFCAAVVIVLAFAGYRVRIGHLNRQARQLQALVEERTGDLKKAKDFAEEANRAKSA
ncbi:MAG: hypothetical protein GY940_33075, partial [bacterium]|nr:hypothetical protein [bacterium]